MWLEYKQYSNIYITIEAELILNICRKVNQHRKLNYYSAARCWLNAVRTYLVLSQSEEAQPYRK